MSDSKRFLHHEAIKRASRLDLRARYIVEGFLAGMHRSPYFGQSIEFRQHRQYVPGDDLRHADWKVWARQDRLYIKQYEAETNLRCHLLVDVSQSMEYGSGELNKYEYGCTIAASLAYLCLRQQDAVGLVAFDEMIRAQLPCRSQMGHLKAIVAGLDVNRPNAKTRLDNVLRKAAETLPRRSLIVIISDLLGDVEATIRGLRLLRTRQHDVLVFHVLDDDELEFPFSGATRFDELEGDLHLNCNPRALRDGYLDELEKFLTRLRHQCAQLAVDYALVRTSDAIDAVLADFLSRRLSSLRR